MNFEFIGAIIIISIGGILFRKQFMFFIRSQTTQPKHKKVHVVIDDTVIDNEEVYAVIDSILWSLNNNDTQIEYDRYVKPLSIPQRYLFAIYWYTSEVNNGGHHQFYFNSTGIVWEDAMNGFKEIGLTELYENLQESAKRFGTTPCKDVCQRRKQLWELKLNFDDIDDKYYENDNKIWSAMMEYIKKNRNDFYFDGIVSKPSYIN